MPLPMIPDVLSRVLVGWTHIATNDAKSMFFQFSLHPLLRKYFGFTLASRRRCPDRYHMSALPMGVCFATFAQHVSNYICDYVLALLPRINFLLFA